MKSKKGIVTSAKMTGTVVVTVHRFVLHPVYKKSYRRSKKFLADSGTFTLHEGDNVEIAECRPLSKRKHFRVMNILKSAPRVSDVKEEGGLEEAMYCKGTKGEKGTNGPFAPSVSSATFSK